MSLLKNKLSALQPGAKVRLTQTNGQIAEGIIEENDGVESLSIRIETFSVFNYTQIGALEEMTFAKNAILPITPVQEVKDTEKDEGVGQSNNLKPDPDPILIEKKENSADYVQSLCCKEAILQSFKGITGRSKKLLQPAHDKVQSFLKSNERAKGEEALDLIWALMKKNDWTSDPQMNIYYARVALLLKDYQISAESFYYANDSRSAYLIADYGAKETKQEDLSLLAASFAVLHICEKQSDYAEEAANVLKRISEKCNDISGLAYIACRSLSENAEKTMTSVWNYFASRNGRIFSSFANASVFLSEIQPFYHNAKISEMIFDYAPEEDENEIPEPIEEKTDEKIDKKEKENESNSIENTEPAKPDVKITYEGQITKYNYFESRGTVTADTIGSFEFGLNDIRDVKLQGALKKMTKQISDPIPVSFKLMPFGKSYLAINLQKLAVVPVKKEEAPRDTISRANNLRTEGKYEEAFQIYTRIYNGTRNDSERAEVFTQLIQCYLYKMSKENSDQIKTEFENFLANADRKYLHNVVNLESLSQAYSRLGNYEKALETCNLLMDELNEQQPTNYVRVLQCLNDKARFYQLLGDSMSAISQYKDWLDIVKRNKLASYYANRNSNIYITIAELYLKENEMNEAEKYFNLASESDRKEELRIQLQTFRADIPDAQDKEEIPESDAFDILSEEAELNVQTAYAEYKDNCGFEALKLDDRDILKKINEFSKDHLYCLLTYAKAAALLTESYDKIRISEDGEEIHIGQSVQTIERAYSYAFNSPLLEKPYISTDILFTFENFRKISPANWEKLFLSSVIIALSQASSVPDYKTEGLLNLAEKCNTTADYPNLLPLIETLYEFRSYTGMPIEAFFGYKVEGSEGLTIVEKAKQLCEALDMRNTIPENHVQTRKTRELIFGDTRSALRECLEIVAANETFKLGYVRDTLSKYFIRANRTLAEDNIDKRKLGEYIDRYWFEARDILKREGGHGSERPYEKLKDDRRTNIITTAQRILACVCEWVASVESIDSEKDYKLVKYSELYPQILDCLENLLKDCASFESKNGFDWGAQSIRRTAEIMLSKIKGDYNSANRKYFFINFLAGEDILLNSKFLPELQSTFCGWEDFNILKRIERHANRELPSLNQRVTEIFSDDETKNNFRSAKLLELYADDMDIAELKEHEDFVQFADCMKLITNRFDSLYQDFNDQLNLWSETGRLSDINGEKTNYLNLALDFYRITRQTNDFGFYSIILNTIRQKIASDALVKGEKLKRQMEELADKPEYDFGVYSKEKILEHISEQNYAVVEGMLNCIRRHDTKELQDYTIEPFSYFNNFMSEHPTNHRAVNKVNINLELAVKNYTGKSNLEFAMRELTNGAAKDIKGGCNLIANWIVRTPAGKDRLEKLLSLLGFSGCTVTADNANSEDSYLVSRQKKTGKINYPHPIPAFSSISEEEGFRVLCLYGKFDCDRLMDMFRNINTAPKHTLVFLDYALNQEERRKLARKIKEEQSFSKTFILVDRVILFYLAKHYAANTVNKMLMAITMPFAYYQPFVESSEKDMPPELFTGREKELTSIESADGASLVYGGRQLGKSVLLKMAQHNVNGNANGDRAILLDVKEQSYLNVVKILSNRLITDGILGEECACDDWYVLADHLKKRLMVEDPEKRINYLLLMLDEADEFIRTSSQNGNIPISALKTLPSNRFKLVMAGLHDLSRYDRASILHKNSTLVHLRSIIIRPFQRPEAVKLLTNTLAYLGFRFNDDIISLILVKTNYFPGLIQLYCQKLLEAMTNNDYAGYAEINTPPYNVTESHYKKVLSDSDFIKKVNEKLEMTLFVEEEGRSSYHAIALLIAYLCNMNSDAKGYTAEDLLRLAKEKNISRILKLKLEQLKELMNEMWDLNVLTAESDRFNFATESFRDMLGDQNKIEESLMVYEEEGDA